MTTRFSLAELADMLHVPVNAIRQAVDTLAENGALTAESFVFMDKNWRISPSDVKRIQNWIERTVASGELVLEQTQRKVRAKRVIKNLVDD